MFYSTHKIKIIEKHYVKKVKDSFPVTVYRDLSSLLHAPAASNLYRLHKPRVGPTAGLQSFQKSTKYRVTQVWQIIYFENVPNPYVPTYLLHATESFLKR